MAETWRLFQRNWRTTILFEVIYKLFLSFFILPFELGLSRLVMRTGGYTYICADNMPQVFASPLSWFIVFVMILLIAVYAVFEFCALIIIAHASKCQVRIRLRDVLELAARQANRVVLPKNYLIIPFVLIIIPLTNIGEISWAISSINVPEFISDYVETKPFLTTLTAASIAYITVLAFKKVFAFQYFTLEECPFHDSTRWSWYLMKDRIAYPLWRLLLGLGIIIFLNFGLSALFGLAVSNFYMLFTDNTRFEMLGTYLLTEGVEWAVACFTTPLVVCMLSALFYDLKLRSGESMPDDIVLPGREWRGARSAAALAGATIILTVGVVLGTQSTRADAWALTKSFTESPGSCEVIAHRGMVTDDAPENTLPAFQNAIDAGADWVELDVQQTEDGTLIVMHDKRLYRMLGVHSAVWNVSYDEIKDVKVKNRFGVRTDATVCTLSDALKLCDGKVRVDIHIKDDGHGTDIEKKTVDTINECGMADQVAIASNSYESLRKVKEYDPDITTIYNMYYALGNISDLEYADIYSVDETFVTPQLVSAVSHNGKQIFAWTVNDGDNMVKRYLYGIDGIITDNVSSAQSICG